MKADRQGAGLHYRLDSEGRFGTVALYVADSDEPRQPPGDVALIWGVACCGVQLGAYYGSFGRTDWDLQAAGGDPARRDVWDHTVGFGLRSDLGERLYVDLAGELTETNRQYETGPRPGAEERDAWTSFAWRSRLFWGVRDEIAIVPLLAHRKEDHLEYSPALADIVDLDARRTRAGLGVLVFPDSDNLVLVSWERRWRKEDQFVRQRAGLVGGDSRQCDCDGTVLRLGFESRLTSWLTLRASARQSIQEQRWLDGADPADGRTPAGPVSVRREPELELALGAAFHFGSFDADFVFNDDAPFSFGHLLTGAGEDETETFTSVTLTYAF
jgi:hypothetical protein